jgi:acyl carrier protein
MSNDPHHLLAVVRATLSHKADGFPSDQQLAAATIDELKLDSLDKLQLVFDLEAKLSVMANETEIAACRTVGELVALMSRTAAGAKRDA